MTLKMINPLFVFCWIKKSAQQRWIAMTNFVITKFVMTIVTMKNLEKTNFVITNLKIFQGEKFTFQNCMVLKVPKYENLQNELLTPVKDMLVGDSKSIVINQNFFN